MTKNHACPKCKAWVKNDRPNTKVMDEGGIDAHFMFWHRTLQYRKIINYVRALNHD